MELFQKKTFTSNDINYEIRVLYNESTICKSFEHLAQFGQ